MRITLDNRTETKEMILSAMDQSPKVDKKMRETFIRFWSVFVDGVQDGSIKLSLEDSALMEAAAQHLTPFEKATLKVLAASIDGTITFADPVRTDKERLVIDSERRHVHEQVDSGLPSHGAGDL